MHAWRAVCDGRIAAARSALKAGEDSSKIILVALCDGVLWTGVHANWVQAVDAGSQEGAFAEDGLFSLLSQFIGANILRFLRTNPGFARSVLNPNFKPLICSIPEDHGREENIGCSKSAQLRHPRDLGDTQRAFGNLERAEYLDL